VLFAASREMEMNLVEISGGSKDNAIPREASCRITLEKAEKENLELIVKEHQRYFAKEFKGPESSIKLDLKHVDSKCDKVIDDESTNKIISAILLIPNGVISMSNEIENMPVSSANIGVIETKDDEVVISIAARSSVASKKEEIISINRALSSQFETHISFHGDYPGWSYAEESPLRDTAQRVYKELFNQEAKIVAVHAGVECGIFGEKIPGLDMISIGPNIFDVHSPDERLSISSTEKTWKFLTELLEEIK
jgi:dipeptidase D